MLDSYIIDRIRREREQQERAHQIPLRIERQPPPYRPPPESVEPARDAPKRGSIVIDFRL